MDGLQVAEVATGKCLANLLSRRSVWGVNFNPDGTLAIATIFDFGVAIFDLKKILGKESSV